MDSIYRCLGSFAARVSWGNLGAAVFGLFSVALGAESHAKRCVHGPAPCWQSIAAIGALLHTFAANFRFNTFHCVPILFGKCNFVQTPTQRDFRGRRAWVPKDPLCTALFRNSFVWRSFSRAFAKACPRRACVPTTPCSESSFLHIFGPLGVSGRPTNVRRCRVQSWPRLGARGPDPPHGPFSVRGVTLESVLKPPEAMIWLDCAWPARVYDSWDPPPKTQQRPTSQKKGDG